MTAILNGHIQPMATYGRWFDYYIGPQKDAPIVSQQQFKFELDGQMK